MNHPRGPFNRAFLSKGTLSRRTRVAGIDDFNSMNWHGLGQEEMIGTRTTEFLGLSHHGTFKGMKNLARLMGTGKRKTICFFNKMALSFFLSRYDSPHCEAEGLD